MSGDPIWERPVSEPDFHDRVHELPNVPHLSVAKDGTVAQHVAFGVRGVEQMTDHTQPKP